MRSIRNHFGWIALSSLLILCACQATDSAKRPNFLVLISDDQRYDQLSYMDEAIIPELATPHIDALAKDGVYFSNGFVTTPICAVSRASIMTGRYVSSHGMNHFNTPIHPEVLAQTYPGILHEAGYRTGLLGKWGIGIEGTDRIFDVFEAWANQGAYFHLTDSGRIHNSEWLAAKADAFLKNSHSDTPFCLTVCFKSPHHPYQPDPRDQNLFSEVSIPKRITDTPEAYDQLAGHIMDSSLNRWCYFDERRDEATREKFEKDFLRCVVSLDRSVGKIMQSLADYGFDENTVTIFISDNGYLWGEHGLGGKWLLYEESIRVPIIVKDPRFSKKKKGLILDQMALNIDLAPTILDFAGIAQPDVMNGKSLLRPILNHRNSFREDFFLEHVGVIEVETPIPDSRGVRTQDWKYIQYLNQPPEVEELYYLRDDPFEIQNLSDDPDYKDIVKKLRERCQDYSEQVNQTYEKQTLSN